MYTSILILRCSINVARKSVYLETENKKLYPMDSWFHSWFHLHSLGLWLIFVEIFRHQTLSFPTISLAANICIISNDIFVQAKYQCCKSQSTELSSAKCLLRLLSDMQYDLFSFVFVVNQIERNKTV